ncbi:protein of unknown function [Streptomyces murinus]
MYDLFVVRLSVARTRLHADDSQGVGQE